ncbi:hypothetical protein [Salegentibacter chungangensis]|uniref:Riboflavin synthase subunit beta n=1 Tax=Salegentibacter chungangensis TaxID=1335724 RepID=A0ABW3NRW9_9FLAO
MSFGSTRGAIVSLKNNRREKKSKFSKFRNSTGSISEGIKSEKRISEAELLILKTKLNREHQKRQLKIITITTAFLIVLGVLFYKFMF